MSPPTEIHEVACWSCKARFDALQAAWCSCIVSERSLVCPSCLKCFCESPPSYKRQFWSSAPKALWDRKFGEHETREIQENPPPGHVPRPMVLLVDDEPDILRVAGRVIESLGYGLLVARNGQDGLELAETYGPDLVLADALMPKLDGREMCRRIKANPATAAIKVVVMTSLYTGIKYETEAYRRFKVDGYLAKPVTFEGLRDVLDRQLPGGGGDE
jgi:CheY-like chemotaxis protein